MSEVELSEVAKECLLLAASASSFMNKPGHLQLTDIADVLKMNIQYLSLLEKPCQSQMEAAIKNCLTVNMEDLNQFAGIVFTRTDAFNRGNAPAARGSLLYPFNGYDRPPQQYGRPPQQFNRYSEQPYKAMTPTGHLNTGFGPIRHTVVTDVPPPLDITTCQLGELTNVPVWEWRLEIGFKSPDASKDNYTYSFILPPDYKLPVFGAWELVKCETVDETSCQPKLIYRDYRNL